MSWATFSTRGTASRKCATTASITPALPAKQDVIDSILGEVDFLITGVGD